MEQSPRVLIVVGEVSGDRQGAHLARAIRRREPNVKLYGAGGGEMLQAGVHLCMKTSGLSSVGLQESLPHLLSLWRAYRVVQELVKSEKPDAAVLIDNETFSMAIARKLKEQNIPVIYYFPPQVSIWGRWRIAQVVETASLILTPFRADAEAYEKAGVRVVCVGHPLLDIIKPALDATLAFTRAGLDPLRPTVALLPGSRPAEIRRLTPVMLSAVQVIKRSLPKLQVVLPLAAPHCLEELKRQVSSAGMSGEVTVVTGEIYTILSRCAVALVKAGTSTLETALLSVPMVVAYRLSTLSYAVARMVVHTPFIAMPNILLQQLVVPEFCQSEATGEHLAAAALRILGDAEYAQGIRMHLGRVRTALGPPGAVDRAAGLVLREASREESETEAACVSSGGSIAPP